MAICESCGNDYERTIQIQMKGRTHVFDCFECAIHKLAPNCSHCGTRVIGHGVEMNTEIYCCAHCAEASGKSGFRDQIRTTDAA
ncbi:MAG: hypothetical protein ABIQ95_07400 [Bdellovibrionia bacterium]